MHAVGFLLACLACTCHSRQVQTSLERSPGSAGVRDWELENIARQRAGDMNDAELRLANLRNALNDPSLLSEVAQYLWQPEGRAELIKLMAHPTFQGQAKHVVEQMSMSDSLTDIFKLEYYAGMAGASVGGTAKTRVAQSPDMFVGGGGAPAKESRELAGLKSMAGVTEPLGYFDPFGYSIGAPPGKVRFYREVELKHGRVAMLAALGFPVGEQFHPLFGGDIDSPSLVAFQQTPLETFWGVVVLAIAIPEVFSVLSFEADEVWSIRSDHEPGDFGFDPLGLKPTDAEELKTMQTKELNNGRLAMLAIAGMVAQEMVTGEKLF